MPPNSTTNWITSVHITVRIPPRAVYKAATPPANRISTGYGMPVSTPRMRAEAYRAAAIQNSRHSMNRPAASNRVRRSKRFSR